MVNRDLIIVVDDKFDERKKFDLIRRPTSLKLIDGICYVADRSGDVYEVRDRTFFLFLQKVKRFLIKQHATNFLNVLVTVTYNKDQNEKNLDLD